MKVVSSYGVRWACKILLEEAGMWQACNGHEVDEVKYGADILALSR